MFGKEHWLAVGAPLNDPTSNNNKKYAGAAAGLDVVL